MKNKLKLLIAVAVVILSVFCLFSCDNDETTTEAGTGKVTVTIDLDGGRGIATTEYQVKIGEKLSARLTTPIKDGYIFGGWYLEDGTKWKTTTKFEEDAVITAKWTACEHDWEDMGTRQATCTASGYVNKTCTICGLEDNTTSPKLGHDLATSTVAPTCAEQGYTLNECKRCDFTEKTDKVPATGNHILPDNYITTVQPTKYGNGEKIKRCTTCMQIVERAVIPPTADMDAINIDTFKYTGGKYNNQTFVNIAGLSGVEASSVYSVTSPLNTIDADPTTVWQPDTLVDGGNFTGEWIQYIFEEIQDIGAVRLTMANYGAWELGSDCYQSYDIEAWVSGQWQKVGEINDKDCGAGLNATKTTTFANPVTTDKIRLVVTKSGRYTPAMIRETEILAYDSQLERVSKSLYSDPLIEISSIFNDYAGGADKINDNHNMNTYWFANGQNGDGADYMIATYPKEEFITYVTWMGMNSSGREYKLEYWVKDSSPEGGHFEEVGTYPSQTGVMSADVEKKTSKLKLTFSKVGEWWSCYLYDFEAFTIQEVSKGVADYTGCKHKLIAEGVVSTTQPSCTTAGYSVMKCKNCDYTYKTAAVDKLGHNFGEYVSTATASASVLGTQTATCQRCTQTTVRNVPKTVDGTLEPATIANYYRNAPAAWCMTFDDGNYIGTYEWLKTTLNSTSFRNTMNSKFSDYGVNGFKFTGVVTVSSVGLFQDEWNGYIANGFIDIGSHSANHTGIYTGSTSDKLLYPEVNMAVYSLMSMFPGQRILGFATPNGETADTAAQFIMGMHAACRNGGQRGGNYTSLSDLNSRSVWGNMGSFIARDSTTVAECKNAIDEAIANAGWVVECNHVIGHMGSSDAISIATDVKLAEMEYLKEKGLWVASYNDVIQYVKEAQNCTVNVTDNSSTQIKLSLTDTLDNFMFNFPLTIKVDVPSSWTNVSATQNGATVHVFVEDGYAYVDAVPDAGEIVVTKK